MLALLAFLFGIAPDGQGDRIKIVGFREEKNIGAMREAPAAGSTPDIERPTPNLQFQATLRGWILSLCVVRCAFDVEMLPRVLMRLPTPMGHGLYR